MSGAPSYERSGLSFAALLVLAAACLLSAGSAQASARHGSVHVANSAPAARVEIKAHVRRCPAVAAVRLDGRRLGRFTVRARRSKVYRLHRRVAAGHHRVRVSAVRGRGCRRPALVVDAVRLPAARPASRGSAPPPAPAAPTHPNPLAGMRFYVDPNSKAAQTAAQWRSSGRDADAAQMDKIAGQPQAAWFGDWDGANPAADVRAAAGRAYAAGAVPVLVAYNIPSRDCGGYSGGGAASADAYRAWIDGFASGIDGAAVVVLEPDAVPELDCLDAAGQASALGLLHHAVDVLSQRPGVAVYIDAGNASWQAPATIARRLQQAGINHAAGFSLNVSNFDSTPSEIAYGRQVSALTGGSHFVIDTSRNGQGPAPGGEWCNPPGRGLGHAVTTATGDPLVDAFLWVKNPGESDGTCNGGPTAGQWWPDYALGLAQRSSL